MLPVKRVLVAYFSADGNTETMAEYIAEGVRIGGADADVRKMTDIEGPVDLLGYDGYVFGCPTYHLSVPEEMRRLLLIALDTGLAGKAGGAFSSSAHPGGRESGAAGLVFDEMESGLALKMTDLGPFNLKEDLFDHPDGMSACHDYGKAIAEML